MASNDTPAIPRLGVAIVTFNAADVILDCLESLLASDGVALDIVVADNDSQDATVGLIRDWARGQHTYNAPADCPFQLTAPAGRIVPLNGEIIAGSGHRLTLVETGVNGGFAAGVNAALAQLALNPAIEKFWILNPDSLVPSDTARKFATYPEPDNGFALMGGRILYCDGTGRIQIDGGTLNRFTGVTGNINLGRLHKETSAPDASDQEFISGASMVASRKFYNLAGPMPEEYFLYYEEVDWALRRGELPLLYCPGAVVYHRAGTAIGSPTLGRPASPFSLYFKHRARLRFIRSHFPTSIPIALLYSVAKAAQLVLKGYRTEAFTILAASFNRPPSDKIRASLSPAARAIAFPNPK